MAGWQQKGSRTIKPGSCRRVHFHMDLVNSPSLRRSQRTRTRSTNHLLQIIPELVEDDDEEVREVEEEKAAEE